MQTLLDWKFLEPQLHRHVPLSNCCFLVNRWSLWCLVLGPECVFRSILFSGCSSFFGNPHLLHSFRKLKFTFLHFTQVQSLLL